MCDPFVFKHEEHQMHLPHVSVRSPLLSHNLGKVLTHTYITQNIWGKSWDNYIASLRVFMATLRRNLEPTPDSPQYIQTQYRCGI